MIIFRRPDQRLAVLSIFVSSSTALNSVSHAGVITIQQTDITGANTQLDSDHSYFWAFSNTDTVTTWDEIKAVFKLKENGATADAVLTLYEADSSSATGNVIGSASLSALVGTNSYIYHDFSVWNSLDGAARALPSYFNLTFTSATGTSGSQQWFIKGPIDASNFTFSDGANSLNTITFLGAGSGTSGGTSAFNIVPEPNTVTAMGLLGVVGFAGNRRRRRLATV